MVKWGSELYSPSTVPRGFYGSECGTREVTVIHITQSAGLLRLLQSIDTRCPYTRSLVGAL